MNKAVIAVLKSDEAVMRWAQIFANEGGSDQSRRMRLLEPSTNGRVGWEGKIFYGPGHAADREVKLILVDRFDQANDADWLVFSSNSTGGRRFFTSVPKNMGKINLPTVTVPKNDGEVDLPTTSGTRSTPVRLLALFPEVAKKAAHSNRERKLSDLLTCAANHLAAEVTAEGVFRPDFLKWPSGDGGDHFMAVADWVKDDRPIHLISAACLNADEPRTGIVDRLSPDIVEILVRTAVAAFAGMPQVQSWTINTFGPEDFDWLGELGMAKVLLPYMWHAPAEKVREDMARNYALVERLVAQLDKHLPFPVRIEHLRNETEGIDVSWLIEEAGKRAKMMMPGLLAQPPLIFKMLATEEEKYARVLQEAMLYLLETVKHGQRPGEDRRKVVCVGFEVHGGYWFNGKLYQGSQGEFLPLAWFPAEVCQHWAPWAWNKQVRQRELLGLKAILNHMNLATEVKVTAEDLMANRSPVLIG